MQIHQIQPYENSFIIRSTESVEYVSNSKIFYPMHYSFLKKILEMHFIIEYMVKINLAETFQFYFPELS